MAVSSAVPVCPAPLTPSVLSIEDWSEFPVHSPQRTALVRNFSRNFTRLVRQDPRSVRQLARDMGVSPTSVMHWQSGTRKPQYAKLWKIADCFSVPFSELLKEE